MKSRGIEDSAPATRGEMRLLVLTHNVMILIVWIEVFDGAGQKPFPLQPHYGNDSWRLFISDGGGPGPDAYLARPRPAEATVPPTAIIVDVPPFCPLFRSPFSIPFYPPTKIRFRSRSA